MQGENMFVIFSIYLKALSEFLHKIKLYLAAYT